MSDIFDLRVKVSKEMFYNDQSSFGAYGLIPLTNIRAVNLDSKWGNFVVTGNTPKLIEGNEYDISITPSYNKKYGNGYTFVSVQIDKPTTVKEQQEYVRAMINPKYADAIIKKYPTEKLIDLFKEDKIDYSDIKGIQEKTYQKLKETVLEHIEMQEALTQLKDLNITFEAMKKLIKHFGTAEMVVYKVNDNIYSLCEVKYFGFLKVDEYAMNRGDEKDSPNRIVSAIKYLLSQEEQSGHCWIDKNELTVKLVNLLQIDSNPIQQVIENIDGKDDLIVIDNKIALYKNYFYESEIIKHLHRLMSAKSDVHVDNVDEKIKKLESDNGFTYTDEQKEAIHLAVNNNVFILNGKGGTGKTTTINAIMRVLSNYEHACCALSGKASNVLKNHGLEAMTIHRLLGVDPNGGFVHNSLLKLKEKNVVIDEASMCSNYILYSVISAIEDGSKLIILGDSGQLAAIGAGAVFDDLLTSGKFPMKELTQVHRQAQKSGILMSANTIRDGQQIVDRYDFNQKVYGELRDFVLFPVQDKATIKDIAIEICQKYASKHVSDFQVICGLRSRGELSVKNMNIELQKIFNDMRLPCIKRGWYEYRVGDKIIHNGNNYNAGENEDVSVFNGTLGRIVDIEFDKFGKGEHNIKMEFEGINEIIEYEQSQMDMVELAYAISCHRSQGSTIKFVLFVFDYSSYMLLSRQFVYTGITRAAKGCVLITENRALQYAVNTDHSGMRRTFLKDLLVNGVNE